MKNISDKITKVKPMKQRLFQQMMLEQQNIHMQKKKSRHKPYTLNKINSKWGAQNYIYSTNYKTPKI